MADGCAAQIQFRQPKTLEGLAAISHQCVAGRVYPTVPSRPQRCGAVRHLVRGGEGAIKPATRRSQPRPLDICAPDVESLTDSTMYRNQGF